MKKPQNYTIDEIKSVLRPNDFEDMLYNSKDENQFIEYINELFNERIDFAANNNVNIRQYGIKRNSLHMINKEEEKLLIEHFNEKRNTNI